MKKHRINITDLLIFIVSAELAGALSALLSGGFRDFFIKYEKPPLLPNAGVFPVVWTILYAVMGISAYLIYSSGKDRDDVKTALKVYWAQLFVNFSWSIIFFRFELLWLAVGVVVLLLALIAVMIKLFKDIHTIAGYMNIPYLVWVAFATYLTVAIAVIN